MKWRDDNSNLDNVAFEMLRNKKKVSAKCCEKPIIHVYADRDGEDRKNASAWIWCSACGSFSHLDRVPVHDAWENCKEIDSEGLTAEPDYLAEHENVVDRHMNRFLEADHVS